MKLIDIKIRTRRMKLVIILSMAVFLQVLAADGNAQNVKVNIHLKGAKIESIL